MEHVTIWSKGTRIAGNLYRPATMREGETYPVVVCCHGWGAPLKHVVHDTGLPDKLAAAGFFVLAFDYRGWGESDGILVAEEPLPQGATEATLRVRIIREFCDLAEWLTDIQHAIDFVEGEPGVDRARIGLWGSSLGGGMVIWMAANDPRVKCVVSQAGAQDLRGTDYTGEAFFPKWSIADLSDRAMQQARNPVYPLPLPADSAWLPRQPVDANLRFAHYSAIEWAERVRTPVRFVDAEHENLWDRHKHSEALYHRIKAARRAPVDYRVIPGIEHIAVYHEAAGAASDLAVEWFTRYLQPAAAQ